jgi:hypothetical protein
MIGGRHATDAVVRMVSPPGTIVASLLIWIARPFSPLNCRLGLLGGRCADLVVMECLDPLWGTDASANNGGVELRHQRSAIIKSDAIDLQILDDALDVVARLCFS